MSHSSSRSHGSLLLIFLAILILAQTASAQVNTESLRKEDLSLGSHYLLNTNLSLVEGNSTVFHSHVTGRIDHIYDWGSWFLSFKQKMSSKDRNLYINQGFAHLRIMKPLRGQLVSEGFIQQEYNEFINLQSRSLAGLGLRMKLQNGDKESSKGSPLSVILGIGLMIEDEQMDAGDSGLEGDPVHGKRAQLLRSSNYLSLRWSPSPSMSFGSTSYYQVDTRRLADYRILSQSQFKYDLSKRWGLIFNLDVRFDSEPPQSIEGLDLEFSQGISYRFK